MTPAFDFEALARYNAEVARGLVHTDEWREKMAREQERFDIAYRGAGKPEAPPENPSSRG